LKYVDFPFIGEAYKSKVKRLDAQTCVNLYYERGGASSKAQGMLIGTPGTVLETDLGPGPGRAIYATSTEQCFAIVGNKLFEIFSDTTSALRGTLDTNAGLVDMVDNGTQIMIVDGVKGYLYFMADSAPNVAGDFIQITSLNFPNGTNSLTYADGYFIVLKPGPIGTGLFAISDSLDGRVWDGLEFGNAEASPDKNKAIRAVGRHLVTVGTKSKEHFYNSGDVSFPYDRVEGGFFEVGALTRESVAVLRGQLYWLGAAVGGSTSIWRLQGLAPQKISTVPMDVGMNLWDDAVAYTYEQEGHAFYIVTSVKNRRTWAFDATQETWHERRFRNPDTGEEREHYVVAAAFAFQKNLVLTRDSGKIFRYDLEVGFDDGDTITRERAAQPLHKDGGFITIYGLKLEMETGVGTGTGPGPRPAEEDFGTEAEYLAALQAWEVANTAHDPHAMLTTSKDGGYNFGNEVERPLGKVGQRKIEVKWTRLGTSDDWVLRVRFSTPRRVAIIKADLEAVMED
jgi:hypothetical protein